MKYSTKVPFAHFNSVDAYCTTSFKTMMLVSCYYADRHSPVYMHSLDDYDSDQSIQNYKIKSQVGL